MINHAHEYRRVLAILVVLVEVAKQDTACLENSTSVTGSSMEWTYPVITCRPV